MMKRIVAVLVALMLTVCVALSAFAEEADPPAGGITPYAYYAADPLPRIDILTEEGKALDDSSLVIPGKYKGFGNIPEYDYVNAVISVSDCEGYELDGAEGKVKIRGNFTASYPKKPIRIKFTEKQPMCGLNGGAALKNWVLLAEYTDASLLRNSAALYIANSLYSSSGHYASDFRNVEVYLNGEYNGVYVLCEQQEVNKARVNLPEPENPKKHEGETLTEEESAALKDGRTGYLIEYDGYYTNEDPADTFTIRYDWVTRPNGQTFLPASEANDPMEEKETDSGSGSDGASAGSRGDSFGRGGIGTTRTTGFTIKSDFYYPEQNEFIRRTVQTVWDVLYDAVYTDHSDLSAHPYYTMDEYGNRVAAPAFTTAYEAVASVVDIGSLVDMYILQEIVQDTDLDWSSFYFSIDMSPEGNRLLTYTAPWDFDNGFGLNQDNTALFAMNFDNPWFVLFWGQDWFWQRVNDRFDEAAEAGVFTGVLEMLDTVARVNEAAYERNRERWTEDNAGSGGSGGSGGSAAGQTQAQAEQSLHTWLETKLQNLDRLINEKAGK